MLALYVSNSVAVQCYTCSDTLDTTCGESGFVAGGQDTEDDCTYCQKTVGGALGVSVTTRSCSLSCTESNIKGGFGVKSISACCQTDLCNGAPWIKAATGILIAGVAAVFLL